LQDAGAIILSVATNRENCEGAATNFRKNNACQELERTKWALEIHDDIGGGTSKGQGS